MAFAAMTDSAHAQGPRLNTRWQGKAFILLESDTTLAGIVWRIDTLGMKAWLGYVVDSLLTTASLGWDPDSADVLFTTGGGRLLTENVINPGSDGDFLITAGGAATWTATPNIADRVGQYFTWTSIEHNNAADTGSGKNQAYVGAWGTSRLWPIPHGTTYSAITASFYMRSVVHNRYTATMTTVGSGATALQAGDALVMRFRPASVIADKQVRVYRIPDGFRADGWGSGPAVYGEHIGTFTIPTGLFSTTTTTTNLECELTLKVK